MPRLKDLLSQRKSAATAEKASSSGGAPNAENRSEVQLSGLEATVLPLPSSAPDIGAACSEQEELLAAGISGVASLEGPNRWDRKFRDSKKSISAPPLRKERLEDTISVPKDPLRSFEALHASVADRDEAPAGSAEDDLFDWDPKEKQSSELDRAKGSKGKVEKKKKAPTSLPAKKRGKKAAFKESGGAFDEGQAQAAPNLEDAPSDGVAEPLLLLAPTDDGTQVRVEVPGSINRYLRQYQREGIQFLFRQYVLNQGAILADDMGLGKTVQTIGFVAAILGKTGTNADLQPVCADTNRPKLILIVAPSSVITNWQRELSTWGAFRVAIYHGSSNSKEAAMQSISHGTVEIILTTYDTLRTNIDMLREVDWHAAIFDECHKLKNKRTTTKSDNISTYGAANCLGTKRRYGLTGTAMQNDYGELWSLLHWANPTRMGDWEQFQDFYVKPLKEGQRRDCTDLQLAKAHQRQERLDKLLKQYMLRRTKESTIKDQLPKKMDNIVFCKLAPLQMRAYRRVLNTPDFQLLVRSEEKCDCGSGSIRAKCCYTEARPGEGGVLWPHFHLCTCDNAYDECSNPKGCKRHRPNGCEFGRLRCPYCLVLPCLTILQKISNHLELIKVDPEDKNVTEDEWALPRAKELAQMVFGEDLEDAAGDTLDRNFLHLSSSAHCGKMAALEHLLLLWSSAGNNKVLVFSHSVKMLNIIEQLIVRAGYHYARLDGSTKREERQALCDSFNQSPSIFLFLISTTAGGLGLNLTAANKVVIIDPSWNPAHDLQAQDRAFRIGQHRDVSVYRLIAAGMPLPFPIAFLCRLSLSDFPIVIA
ncbi:g4109 [Coccomyxa elongata]